MQKIQWMFSCTFGMLSHNKFVPDIFTRVSFITLLQMNYKTNFANSVCNLPLTKLSPISKDGPSGKWYYLDLFYENQNDKYNTELDEIGFVWTSSCTRCFSNRK